MADETYRDYVPKLGPPWLQGERGTARAEGVGASFDQLCLWCAAAVRARVIALASEDALAHLGEERQLERAPDEFLEAYRARVADAWAFWRLGGTRPGMELALEQLGYAAIVIEHGLPEPYGETPPDKTWWSEFTVFLGPGLSAGWGTAQWGQATPPFVWGQPELRWGTTMTAREMGRIVRTICKMKSAHSRPRDVWYAPNLHVWGEAGLEWDGGTPWGLGTGSVEVPLPAGRVCRENAAAPIPPAGGPRWGTVEEWRAGKRWGTE